jgi:threonine/homoserine/homoserine lactone efflux protein
VDARLLLRGLVIGFSIAAPVGPIGVLCIRRTLADGRAFGLLSGLGAATADAIYGCIAGFVLYLGVKTFLSKVAKEAAPVKGVGLAGAYASTLFLTLTNPMTILSFVGIFAGMGLAESSTRGAALTVLGVFLGSALWWLALSGVVGLFQDRVGQGLLRWVNRISGAVIAGFGALALLSLVL